MACLQMPETFKGKLSSREATCGICGKRYGFWRGTTDRENRAMVRSMGWTFRTDLGWVCPCRHACHLDATQEPNRETKRPRTRRYPRPSKRIRALAKKRNRREIE